MNNLTYNHKNNNYNLEYKSVDIMTLLLQEEQFMKDYSIDTIIKKNKNKLSLKVLNNLNKLFYFVKIKLASNISLDEKYIYNFLTTNKNKYIENIISTNETKYLYFIFSEFIDSPNNLNLYDYINKYNLDNIDYHNILTSSLIGLNFLHNNNIIHGDIKPHNIMFDINKNLKLIDFDMARVLKDEYLTDKNTGTEYYIPPETYDLKLYSNKSDIWSLGMSFYYLFTKKFPYKYDYSKFNNFYLKNIFKDLNLDELNNYEYIFDKSKKSLRIIKYLKSMLNFNDLLRPSCSKLLEKLKYLA
jgi:serine/threonine protein kinase